MEQITLENYRCFRERQTARLAPLTLLVGENSTGKTSFLAMVRALWDITNRQRVPDFKEQPYDLGSYDEIANFRGGRAGRAQEFEAGFKASWRGKKASGSARFSVDITFAKRETAPVPVKVHVCNADKTIWMEIERLSREGQCVRFGTHRGSWEWNRKESDIDYPWRRVDPVTSLFVVLDRMQILIDGRDKSYKELRVLSGSDQPGPEDWESVREVMFSQFRYSHRKIPYLYASAPVRSKPHRTYDPSRPVRDPEGDYIPMYLANVYVTKKREWAKMKDSLEDFGKRSGLFDEISIKSYGKKGAEPFQLQIRKLGQKSKGPMRNLIDVGYGVSQVLPVITELARSNLPTVFLLQQPEVHLHPSAQAALGSLFCNVAKAGHQLIVETHSDYILDRVRFDVRDEIDARDGKIKLKPEDVSILFFERGDLDVRIHSIRIDEMGNILDAPQSYRQFFMDETKRALNL